LRRRRAVPENAAALGKAPFPEEQLIQWRAEKQAVLDTYGAGMARPSGWALPLFPGRMGNPRSQVGFIDLEALAALDHLRVFYRLGSRHVHAGPRASELTTREVVDGHTMTPGATVYADLLDTCDVAINRLLLITATLVKRFNQAAADPDVGLVVGLHALQRLQADAAAASERAWQRAVDLGWLESDQAVARPSLNPTDQSNRSALRPPEAVATLA
jgi:hypothetical protein